MWRPPSAPDSFYQALPKDVNALNAALQAAGQNTSTIGIFAGYGGVSPDPASLVQFEQSRFDPTNWTNAGTFVQNLAGTNLWTAQSQTATALLQPPTLPAETYFFLLRLLMVLPTGAAAQQLAQQIVSAPASSQEYPNDTFINQLIYLALMYLGDPLGPYGWSNAQLQTALADITSVVANVGPAAPLILTSLAQHQKLLYAAAASYPLVDPYNPGIGFTQRKTDTLAALDKARASLNAALPAAEAPLVTSVRRQILRRAGQDNNA